MTTATAIKLEIEGMHCAACVRRVTKALDRIPGVQVSEVRIGEATVSYDPRLASVDSIAAAVDAIGFHASPDQARG